MALRAEEPLAAPCVAQPKRPRADRPGRESNAAARTRGYPTSLVLFADLPLLGGRELRCLVSHARFHIR